MSENKYWFVHDLESDKMHVHTSRQGWKELPDDLRDIIKRYCLFSRTQECWVSKGYASSVWWKDKLIAGGFENRGKEGEKLSFAEKIEAKQERAEARAERMEARKEKAEAQSNALSKRSFEMMDAIPFGQPILVGHYSEKRDRNYRDRAWNMMGRAVAEGEKAKHYAERAAAARDTADGSKYSDPRYLGNRIKEVETEMRDINRRLDDKTYSAPITDEYRERMEKVKAEVQDKLDFFQACMKDAIDNGAVVYSKETLKGKKEVLLSGRWWPIVRLNPTTVAVPNICFPTAESQCKWALKYAYTEVKDAR